MPIDLIAPGRLRVGFNRGDALGRDIMVVNNASGSAEKGHVLIEAYEAALFPSYQLSRFRGTVAAPVSVAKDDQLGSVTYFGYVAGAAATRNAALESYVDAAIVANQSPATRITFRTAVNNTLCRPVAHFSTEGYFALGVAFDLSVAATRPTAPIHLVGSGAGADTVHRHEAYEAANSPKLIHARARGTFAAPATVVNADVLMHFRAAAYTNAWHEDLAGIQVLINAAVVAGQAPQTDLKFFANANNAVSVNIMTALSTGVRIGNTGYNSQFQLHVIGSATGTRARVQNNVAGATADGLSILAGDNAITGSKLLQFSRPDLTEIGSVSQNAAGTVIYNITSDRRLKADIADSPIGLADLMKIQVREFRYKTDPTGRLTHGFIAQELESIYPDAVSVGRESKDCDCDLSDEKWHDLGCCHANPWGVDYGRVTPLLVRALQQLAIRVAAMDGKGL